MTLCHQLSKNAWTDWDAVWVMDSGGLTEPCSRWGFRSPLANAQFLEERSKDMPGHARQYSAMSCAEMAEPIEMQFGLWTLIDTMKHGYMEMHIGTTWRIRLNRPCSVAMLPFCQITLTTCYYCQYFFFMLTFIWVYIAVAVVNLFSVLVLLVTGQIAQIWKYCSKSCTWDRPTILTFGDSIWATWSNVRK